ncbi:unnamed protein product [Coregonus sp. 'balchen']|nr:unnamed protein product [Coregonus sp. 'balchen']
MAVEIVIMLTGLLADAALLWLQLKGGKAPSASKGPSFSAGEAITLLNLVGCPTLLACMCVERYPAATQPILYLHLGKWEYRVAVCGLVGAITLSLVIGFTELDDLPSLTAVISVLFLLKLGCLGSVVWAQWKAWQVSSVGAWAVPNMPMAMTGAGGLQCRRNSKLDSFLKRNTERGVYERIRAYEPCVVVSERVNKVFMHVVLSDECVYLAEYPPRTLTTAVDFRHIRDIELVNDLPEFLSGRDRERSQHIRVVYATSKPSGKKIGLLRGEPHLPPVPSTRQHWPISPSMEGIGGTLLSTRSEPPDRDGWNVSPVTMRMPFSPIQSHSVPCLTVPFEMALSLSSRLTLARGPFPHYTERTHNPTVTGDSQSDNQTQLLHYYPRAEPEPKLRRGRGERGELNPYLIPNLSSSRRGGGEDGWRQLEQKQH